MAKPKKYISVFDPIEGIDAPSAPPTPSIAASPIQEEATLPPSALSKTLTDISSFAPHSALPVNIYDLPTAVEESPAAKLAKIVMAMIQPSTPGASQTREGFLSRGVTTGVNELSKMGEAPLFQAQDKVQALVQTALENMKRGFAPGSVAGKVAISPLEFINKEMPLGPGGIINAALYMDMLKSGIKFAARKLFPKALTPKPNVPWEPLPIPEDVLLRQNQEAIAKGRQTALQELMNLVTKKPTVAVKKKVELPIPLSNKLPPLVPTTEPSTPPVSPSNPFEIAKETTKGVSNLFMDAFEAALYDKKQSIAYQTLSLLEKGQLKVSQLKNIPGIIDKLENIPYPLEDKYSKEIADWLRKATKGSGQTLQVWSALQKWLDTTTNSLKEVFKTDLLNPPAGSKQFQNFVNVLATGLHKVGSIGIKGGEFLDELSSTWVKLLLSGVSTAVKVPISSTMLSAVQLFNDSLEALYRTTVLKQPLKSAFAPVIQDMAAPIRKGADMAHFILHKGEHGVLKPLYDFMETPEGQEFAKNLYHIPDLKKVKYSSLKNVGDFFASAFSFMEETIRSTVADAVISGRISQKAGKILWSPQEYIEVLKKLPQDKYGDLVGGAAREAMDISLNLPASTAPMKRLGSFLDSVPFLRSFGPFTTIFENSVARMLRVSPIGALRIFTPENFLTLAREDPRKAAGIAGEAIISAGIMFGAWNLRNSEYAGEAFGEVAIPLDDGTKKYYDLSWMPVIGPYLFLSDIAKKALHINQDTGSPMPEAISQAINTYDMKTLFAVLGTGKLVDASLYILATASNKSPKDFIEKLQKHIGVILGGFATPISNIKNAVSIFSDEENKMRDTSEFPMTGQFLNRVPYLSQKLPEKFTATQEGTQLPNQPVLKALGFNFYGKSPLKAALDRLNMSQYDVDNPNFGNLELALDVKNKARMIVGNKILNDLNRLVQSSEFLRLPEHAKGDAPSQEKIIRSQAQLWYRTVNTPEILAIIQREEKEKEENALVKERIDEIRDKELLEELSVRNLFK